MAYASHVSTGRKAQTLTAVAALHAAAIFAIVGAFTVAGTRKFDPPITTFTPTPEPKPVDPPTAKPSDPIRHSADPVIPDNPLPPIDNRTPPLDLGPTGGEIGAGGGEIAHVEFPIPPSPTPRFTAKGPKARGNSGSWVRQEDYPSRAISSGLEGLTRVRLTVGANGRVTDCAVTTSSGHDILDAAACAKLIERARFDPATDTSGQVAAGAYNTSVRWQLPE